MADDRPDAITGHVYIAASLDGFIARRDGGIDWLEQRTNAATEREEEREGHGYDAFIERMDGMIMGRGTYEKVLTFGAWPYPKPVVVLSSTLSDADLRSDLQGKVRTSSLPPTELAANLFGEGWRRAYVDGGKIIQSFLREGLIADLVITRIPVLIGDGIPLFGSLESDISLEHVDTKAFPSGFVQSKYEVPEALRYRLCNAD